MAKPRATNSKDGRKRIELRLAPIRCDSDLLATYITSYFVTEIGRDDHPKSWAAKLVGDNSIRQLLEWARKEIMASGEELPHYRIGDNNLHDFRDELAKLLEPKLFTN